MRHSASPARESIDCLAVSRNHHRLTEQTWEVLSHNWWATNFIRPCKNIRGLAWDDNRYGRDKFSPDCPLKLGRRLHRAGEELANRTVIIAHRGGNRSLLSRDKGCLTWGIGTSATTRRVLHRSVGMRAILLAPVVVMASQSPMQARITQQRKRRLDQKHRAKDEPPREHSREPFVPQVCAGNRSLGNGEFV